MRKFLAFALLAGVAAPALATDPGDWQGRHHDSAQQSNQNEGSQSGDRHGNHGNRGSGGNFQPQQQVQQQPVMHVESNNGGGSNAEQHRFYHGMPSRFSSGEQSSIQPTGGDHGSSHTLQNR